MAKRTEHLPDHDRTELLGIDELFVEKHRGGQYLYYTRLHEPEMDCCPKCGCSMIKTHNLFSKSYYDILKQGGRHRVISIIYEFYKYRCLNASCGHIFAKEIHFASRDDKVTYRLENEVARMVIAGCSYGYIQDQLDAVTRQAVGQIFHRWIAKKEKKRNQQFSPETLAMLSGMIDETRYTIFLALDDSIRVIEIIFGDESADIAAILRQINTKEVRTILSDCSPIINDAVADFFPQALHIVPAELWFRTAEAEFYDFAHERIKGSTVRRKDELIMTPRADLGYRVGDLNRLLDERPEVKPVYEDFASLRELIDRRGELWVYKELEEWAKEAHSETVEQMPATLYLLQAYRSEIEAQTQHRDAVPNRLNYYIHDLEAVLSNGKITSLEVLKARVLYSVETDLQNWRGVPITDVIDTLSKMELSTKRKRRDPYEYQ